jgi:hypothetical protein
MSKLEMSIQKGLAGFFWSVMEQQPEGYWEPTMDRSLGYFKTHQDCHDAATEWCDEIGIPHPPRLGDDVGSHIDVSVSPAGELEVSYS